MILIGGFYHPVHGLVHSKVLDLRSVVRYFKDASAILITNGIFVVDNQVVNADEFSVVVLHPHDAAQLIRRLNKR